MHYNKTLESYLLSHHLPEALFALKADLVHQPPNATHQQEANHIDSLTTNKGQLYAQARCCKLLMGLVQFSDTTTLPRNDVHFWQLSLSQRQGKLIHPR